MEFSVTSLILAVFIILQCGNCEKMVIEMKSGPPKIDSESKPIPTAGYVIQQITSKIHYIGQLFYFKEKSELILPNRKVNGSIYLWSTNGTIQEHYFKEISHELISTVTPVAGTINQFIFGLSQSLRLLTKNDTDYTLSEPLMHFNDPGYVIYTAHCDINGTMFILLVGATKELNHLVKFYKIQDRKATSVSGAFPWTRSFRFCENKTSMYMIHDHGKKISNVKYNENIGAFVNATLVFDLDEYPEFSKNMMASVVVDQTEGNLWVTAAGIEGYVLNIDPREKTLISATGLPTDDLTSITFGCDEYETLFVGSKRTCVTGPIEGSLYGISGMKVQGVPDNPIKW